MGEPNAETIEKMLQHQTRILVQILVTLQGAVAVLDDMKTAPVFHTEEAKGILRARDMHRDQMKRWQAEAAQLLEARIAEWQAKADQSPGGVTDDRS